MSRGLEDVRFGIRMLRKAPGQVLVGVLAVGLAIGAASTVFSAVDHVLLRSAPFPDPDRLVTVWQIRTTTPDNWQAADAANFHDWREQGRSFAAMAAGRNASYTLTDLELPQTPLMRHVTAGYFEVLGVRPLLGRGFTEEEDRPGAAPVMLLAEELWRTQFGADPAVLGKTVHLDDKPFEVVGVMPARQDSPDYGLPVQPQAYLPLALPSSGLPRRGGTYMVIARLAEGVTLAQAQDEMNRISASLATQYPDTNAAAGAVVAPLGEEVVADARLPLLLLLGAVLFVLLVACGNVANLRLTQAIARRREMAIRQALGARLGHLARQLVVENLLLTSLGAALGLLLAAWGTSCVAWMLPSGLGLPDFSGIGVNRSVVAFTLALAVLTGLIFGLVPLGVALKDQRSGDLALGSNRATGGPRAQRLRGALVVVEVAFSLVLLVGAGLMLQSLLRLRALDPGFDAKDVLVFRVSTRGPQYQQGAKREAFFRKVQENIAAVPGVESAGAALGMPFFVFTETPVTRDSAAPPEAGSEPRALALSAMPGFFETMRMPLLRGRGIEAQDTAGSQRVAVVDQTLARQLWGEGDPVGESLTLHEKPAVSYRVVGVAGAVRGTGQSPAPNPVVYVPYSQQPASISMGFAVRTSGEPLSFVRSIEQAIHTVDRGMPMYLVRTLEEQLSSLDWRPRFLAQLLGAFAVLALVLAASGMYAVLSYGVSQRTREIGIRMAFGAQRQDVVRMVLGGGLSLALVGIGIGLGLALGLSRLLESQLYGIAAADPWTYGGISALLAFTTVLSSAFPALRATRVEPMLALRQD